MKRTHLIALIASTLTGALVVASAPANAATTLLRAAASLCNPISAANVIPAGSAITNSEAADGGAGRLRTPAIGGATTVYCPLIELPTLLDLSNNTTADRVSVLYKTSASVNASAQLCSMDNAWSFGGSCSSAQTRTGSGAQSIDTNTMTKQNWQANPSSLHYIYVSIDSSGGPSSSFFTGYTIWHT